MVLVDVGGPPREWATPSVPRPAVQEGLLSLRDLLGNGLLDIAVFSSREGVEVYLDRFGTLEIRIGSWDEPRLRSLLERKGFRRVARLSVLPPSPGGMTRWTPENRQRFDVAQEFLAVEAASVSEAEGSG